MKIYLRFPRKYLKYHRVWNSGFSRWTGLATGLETWKKTPVHLHEFNKQVKCKFSCIKMVVKLFYNPYQALKSDIIIRTLIKDKHITLPILMLYNFQNKKKQINTIVWNYINEELLITYGLSFNRSNMT